MFTIILKEADNRYFQIIKIANIVKYEINTESSENLFWNRVSLFDHDCQKSFPLLSCVDQKYT